MHFIRWTVFTFNFFINLTSSKVSHYHLYCSLNLHRKDNQDFCWSMTWSLHTTAAGVTWQISVGVALFSWGIPHILLLQVFASYLTSCRLAGFSSYFTRLSLWSSAWGKYAHAEKQGNFKLDLQIDCYLESANKFVLTIHMRDFCSCGSNT